MPLDATRPLQDALQGSDAARPLQTDALQGGAPEQTTSQVGLFVCAILFAVLLWLVEYDLIPRLREGSKRRTTASYVLSGRCRGRERRGVVAPRPAR